MIVKTLAIIALVGTSLFIGEALAAEPYKVEIELHGISKHSGDGGYCERKHSGADLPDRPAVKCYDYNEVNLGIGVNVPVSDNYRWKVTGGVYNNSYDDTSAYAGIMYDYPLFGDWFKVGAVVGAVTGYSEHAGAAPIQPIVLPQFTIGNKINLKIRAIPPVGDTDAVVTGSIGVQF